MVLGGWGCLQVYVVYMGSTSTCEEDPNEILWQSHQMLSVVHGGSNEHAQASHVYSYKHVFRGSKLTEEQVLEMANWDFNSDIILRNKNIYTKSNCLRRLLGSQPAPQVAGFSLKGPNNLTPEILKVIFLNNNQPDFTAPGFNILAA
ncbi:hypothetical protein GIB67_026035 [Kingdonia uniflora]|uniref:Inhibitor I9 domain-containing protein n=1 Tax=Kingdonia uniflora TaxID=39325 RepID=A0A7J7M2S3_9MAGN|nr:hypothetical protein GIB67_026035 [Kingdonia uniflora]